ncbi:Integral membrane protein [Pedobacter cryoconitis]|uniref:Integral membrane protein n=1 Tax=Pedobacter cryoconitis TaxID=188932 RepID=A0A127VFQ6_9SPHI|nr:sulfite exporter TauE/SafE family protein [Pedobacter cryoconitis]AMQ00048.1 Integral membrane protein [Pedobacter cryoconitis]
MSDQYLAFLIGLMGSVHCLGMCGPLAFAVPTLKKGWGFLVLDKLSYQGGRIISYCILGAIIGLIGRQIWLAGAQQYISILSGILILIVAASRLFNFSAGRMNAKLLQPFNQLFGYALKHKANHLIIGIVNGFLPCGLVYLALTGALNTGAVNTAIEYMFWYGMGTVPLMFIAGISAGFTSAIFRRKLNQMIPYLMVMLGIWFILRGMELNIPYLSPAGAGTALCN